MVGWTMARPWDGAPAIFPNIGRMLVSTNDLFHKYVHECEEVAMNGWAEEARERGLSRVLERIKPLFFDTCSQMVGERRTIWMNEADGERLDEWKIGEGASVVIPYQFSPMSGWVKRDYIFAKKEDEAGITRVWGDKFWDVFGGLVTFEYFSNDDGSSVTPIELTLAEDRKYVGPHDVDTMDRYIRAFEAEGFNRSFLFQGPPGTGKTSISYALAKKRSGRALHLSIPLIMNYFGVERINDVIEALRPSVLLLDDIHLMSFGNSEKLLHMLEWINEHPRLGTLLIATSNEISSINLAMRRPGRFDEIVIFDYPTNEERREVLNCYAELYGCKDLLDSLGEDFINKLVYHTHRLTHAFIKDLVKSIISLRRLDKDSFIKALEARLVSMRIASDIYSWITKGKVDLSAPLPTEKALKEQLEAAKKKVREIEREMERSEEIGDVEEAEGEAEEKEMPNDASEGVKNGKSLRPVA